MASGEQYNTRKKSVTQEVIECPQCSKHIDDPRTLQNCLHSYCKSCIEAIPKQQNNKSTGWFCPVCNKFSKETEILQNSFVNELLAITESEEHCQDKDQILCKQCPKDKKLEATARCVDCKIELCSDCQITHLNIPILKDHTFVSIIEQNKMIDNLIFCPTHEKKQIEFNCETCETPICSLCNLTEHNTHKTEAITHALERLLPKMERNTGMLEINMEILTAQIRAVTKKIEQTKGEYSICKIKMETKVEKLVKILNTIKIQMGDEITKEETIALGELEKIKKDLENKMNETKILTNLSIATTSKACHTTLLDQIQKVLFKKVLLFAKDPQESINLKIKTPEFHESHATEGKSQELPKLVGNIRYSAPLNTITTSGILWQSREFLCRDLTEILHRRLQKECQTVIEAKWCNRLGYIDNRLCICFANENQIRFYKNTGQFETFVDMGDKSIIVVRKSNNGNIIAGGSSGLYVTDSLYYSNWHKLANGVFSDIAIHGEQFSALDCKHWAIVTYSVDSHSYKIKDPTPDKIWVQTYFVNIAGGMECIGGNVDRNSTFAINNDDQYLVCYQHYIYVFNYEGSLLNKYHNKKSQPALCGKDRTGKILIVGFETGTCHIMEPSQGGNLSKQMETHLHHEQIRDIMIDKHNSIWVLAGGGDLFRLVKYTVKY